MLQQFPLDGTLRTRLQQVSMRANFWSCSYFKEYLFISVLHNKASLRAAESMRGFWASHSTTEHKSYYKHSAGRHHHGNRRFVVTVKAAKVVLDSDCHLKNEWNFIIRRLQAHKRVGGTWMWFNTKGAVPVFWVWHRMMMMMSISRLSLSQTFGQGLSQCCLLCKQLSRN